MIQLNSLNPDSVCTSPTISAYADQYLGRNSLCVMGERVTDTFIYGLSSSETSATRDSERLKHKKACKSLWLSELFRLT